VKSNVISQKTRSELLEVAWALIAQKGRLDLPMSELAAAAGVSRQAAYLAFGSRAGLLEAMVAHVDAGSPALARLRTAGEAADGSIASLALYIGAWIDYLPVIYPVASLLSAAAVTDPTAAAIWQGRMQLLKGRYRQMMAKAKAAGNLAEEWPVNLAADICYELTHIDSWRILVVECGWSPEEFVSSRLRLLSAMVRA